MRRFGQTRIINITESTREELEQILGFFSGAVAKLDDLLVERHWRFFGLNPGEVVITEIELTADDRYNFVLNPKRKGGKKASDSEYLGQCFSFRVGYKDVHNVLYYLDSIDDTFAPIRDESEELGHNFARGLDQGCLYDNELFFEIDRMVPEGKDYRVHLKPCFNPHIYLKGELGLQIHSSFARNRDSIVQRPTEFKYDPLNLPF